MGGPAPVGTTPGADGPGGPGGQPASGEPRPLEPGVEYVAKPDHDALVEQIAAERDSMRNDLQRVAADFENYKKRAAQQREQSTAAAETRLLGELLGVIDDTERAIDHATRDDATLAAATDALTTVHARLNGVVSTHGLVRIETVGTIFDPNLHDALMLQAGPNGEPDDTILQEVQSGWRVGDRVLRHARVIVAGGAG